MSGIIEQPALYLGFASLHLVAGQFLSALVHRARFGESPLVLYRAQGGRHQRITRAIAVASMVWAAGLVAFALSAPFRASFLGTPLLGVPPLAGWVGGGLALAGMLACQAAMGRSFRVGQDDTERPALRDAGPFRVSRNPIYVCSFLCLSAITTWAPCALVLAACAAIGALMHALVLAEERHLAAALGSTYQAYRRRVRRYL